MARGWESKSVEDQQAQAADESTRRAPQLTPQQAARLRHVEGLRLSRQRIVQQIEAARSERHRQMLREALAALDQQLHNLENK